MGRARFWAKTEGKNIRTTKYAKHTKTEMDSPDVDSYMEGNFIAEAQRGQRVAEKSGTASD
jgi:hypothetical protein